MDSFNFCSLWNPTFEVSFIVIGRSYPSLNKNCSILQSSMCIICGKLFLYYDIYYLIHIQHKGIIKIYFKISLCFKYDKLFKKWLSVLINSYTINYFLILVLYRLTYLHTLSKIYRRYSLVTLPFNSQTFHSIKHLIDSGVK